MSRKGKQRGVDIKQEDVLQAVVIADTFNVRFAPITDKKPRVTMCSYATSSCYTKI